MNNKIWPVPSPICRAARFFEFFARVAQKTVLTPRELCKHIEHERKSREINKNEKNEKCVFIQINV